MLQVIPKTPCELVSNLLVLQAQACWVILTCNTAVCGHHHWMDSWVFDNVLPMDCVCMTQELVLVNVHTSTQDLWRKREKAYSQHTALFSLSLPFFSQVTDPDIAGLSQTYSSTRYCMSDALSNLFHTRTKAESGVGLSSWSWETHIWWCLLLWGSKDKAMSYYRYYNLQSFSILLFVSFFLTELWAERINYASCHNKKSMGGLNPR